MVPRSGMHRPSKTPWTIPRHFHARHPLDRVRTPMEGLYPRCKLCGMQVSPCATTHRASKYCWKMTARKLQHKTAADSTLALKIKCLAYGKELQRVEVFKYLEQLLIFDDNNLRAVMVNLKKACGMWARVSPVLWSENSSQRVCRKFSREMV